MEELIMIRYGEISLKGGNRRFFEDKLVANIRSAIADLGDVDVYKTYGRIFVRGVRQVSTAIRRLQGVFGIVSISPVLQVSKEVDTIKTVGLELIKRLDPAPGTTFRVDARRSDKSFPLTSIEINQEVASTILPQFEDLVVDLSNPELRLSIEIREKSAYIFVESYPGMGGLPVGVTGKGLLLLSGGIDSPVAGWMVMKRGVRVDALHFHSFPFTGEKSKEKVINLANILADYNQGMRLWIAPFTEIQKTIHAHCRPALRITIMRRMMIRIADRLAQRIGALILVTGESIGQVASQTLESMTTISAVTPKQIIRPLAAFDKQEIITRAKEIGTYETSIQPYEDCCTVFVPKHPSTRPSIEEAEGAEAGIDWDSLLDKCLADMEVIDIP
ncbi:MAG: tRNA 4-thiouridine(8) synthase ThiI [Limnochordia bacterium]|jgi:thiamine biosynthesis protein ThiI|nr:tRNA 4-thiouridine(8) synthase ThiI [Limnochordia bacterium]